MRTIFILIMLSLSLIAFVGCIEDDPIIEEEVYYTVTFYGFDGRKLDQVTMIKGDGVSAPSVPIVEGYEFVGWDEEFDKVLANLEIHAIYEPIYYTVTFMSEGEIVKVESVKYNENATPPSITRTGYFFKGWEGSLTNITEDKTITAKWEKYPEYGSSYVEDLSFKSMTDYSQLVDSVETETPTLTLSSIKHGGTRGTNELVYYDNTLSFNTNIYGFEIAVDKDGIVIDRATKVSMPIDGFVLSAHGTSINKLEAALVGDILIYKKEQGEVLVYRKNTISNTISIGVEINRLKENTVNANDNYKALDYVQIHKTLNDSIDIYNKLVTSYNSTDYNNVRQLLLNISFMLVEPTSVTVRAMWHYPTRAGTYKESNQEQVEEFLDQVKLMGINRIYLNTNFNGRAIYKSEYLITSLTGSNNYGEYDDYLECFIEEAHLRNIEVYAWTNTLIAGDGSDNTFYSSKGWLLRGFNGENNHGGMYFIDISNDDAFAFLIDVFSELSSKYNLDGIEYDFIRFPNGNAHNYTGVIENTANFVDWGYTDSFLSKFALEYSLTGDIKELIRTNQTIRNNFTNFKMNFLTTRVEELSNAIRDNNEKIKISAAVMPSISGAKQAYLQDWETWIKNGYVDVLEPMIYTADNNHLQNSITNMKNVVGDYATIVAGIFPEGSNGANSMNSSQIAILEDLGIEGSSKFSSRTIFNGLLKGSYVYMNRAYIVLPRSNIDTVFYAYINDLRDKVTNYYSFRIDNPDEKFQDLIDLINNLEIAVDLDYEKGFTEIRGLILEIENEVIRDILENENLKIEKYIYLN